MVDAVDNVVPGALELLKQFTDPGQGLFKSGLFKGDVHSHESAPYLILPILWAPVVSSYS